MSRANSSNSRLTRHFHLPISPTQSAIMERNRLECHCPPLARSSFRRSAEFGAAFKMHCDTVDAQANSTMHGATARATTVSVILWDRRLQVDESQVSKSRP